MASLDGRPAPTPAQQRVRRAAAAGAAKRRLRVVSVILLAVAVFVALAAIQVVGWRWSLLPVGVLVAWLVACRLMVKRERRDLGRGRLPRQPRAEVLVPAVSDDTGPLDAVPAEATATSTSASTSASTAGQRPNAADPRSWDPVPVTLPTYVTKPAAPRSVRTIDLDSTGVWSSGRSESDSDLVREADAREANGREAGDATPKSQRRHA